jgi:hypothetical protein
MTDLRLRAGHTHLQGQLRCARGGLPQTEAAVVSSSGVGSHMILILPPMMISSPGMLTGQPVEVPRLDISGLACVTLYYSTLYPDYKRASNVHSPLIGRHPHWSPKTRIGRPYSQ